MMTKSSLLLLIQKSLAMLDFKRCFHSGSSHCLIPRKGQRFQIILPCAIPEAGISKALVMLEDD